MAQNGRRNDGDDGGGSAGGVPAGMRPLPSILSAGIGRSQALGRLAGRGLSEAIALVARVILSYNTSALDG